MDEKKKEEGKEEGCCGSECCSSRHCGSGRGKFFCGVLASLVLVAAGFGIFHAGKCAAKGGCHLQHQQQLEQPKAP